MAALKVFYLACIWGDSENRDHVVGETELPYTGQTTVPAFITSKVVGLLAAEMRASGGRRA